MRLSCIVSVFKHTVECTIVCLKTMQPPYALTAANFSLAKVNGAMQINISGSVLVLFKDNNTHICGVANDSFYRLASVNSRVRYGVVNLSQHKQILGMAKSSSTPITSVPTMIFYYNGVPKFRYNNTAPTIDALENFVVQSLQSSQSSAPAKPSFASSAKPIVFQKEPQSTLDLDKFSETGIPYNMPWLADEM